MTGKIDFLKGVLLGVAITLYATLIVTGYLSSSEYLKTLLKDWQTLLSVSAAMLASMIAISGVGVQLGQASQHKYDELRRKNLAARAAISQPLSNIAQAQELILDALGAFIIQQPRHPLWNTPLRAPDIQDNDISPILHCLETAEDQAIDDLSELISDIQIQTARLRDFRTLPQGTIITHGNAIERAVDAIVIFARVQRLFRYARHHQLLYESTSLPTILEQNCFLQMERAGVEDEARNRLSLFKNSWLCSKFEGRDT